MVSLTFLKASGCAVVVCSHPPELWIAPSAQTKEVPLNRRMILDGPMSSVRSGSQRCVGVLYLSDLIPALFTNFFYERFSKISGFQTEVSNKVTMYFLLNNNISTVDHSASV